MELLLRALKEEVSLNSFKKSSDSGSLLAPVPGKLIKVIFEEGSEVKKGQTIMILESMKMEFEVKSTKDGVIEKVLVSEGTQVDADTLLASFEKVRISSLLAAFFIFSSPLFSSPSDRIIQRVYKYSSHLIYLFNYSYLQKISV